MRTNQSNPIHSTVNNKERLTVDWFSKVITEFRAELTELQEAQNNSTRRLQQRNCAEDMVELREDFDKLKLEWNSIRLRQDDIEVAIKELQAEAIQRDDDFRRSQIQVSLISYTLTHLQPFFMYMICCTNEHKQIWFNVEIQCGYFAPSEI